MSIDIKKLFRVMKKEGVLRADGTVNKEIVGSMLQYVQIPVPVKHYDKFMDLHAGTDNFDLKLAAVIAHCSIEHFGNGAVTGESLVDEDDLILPAAAILAGFDLKNPEIDASGEYYIFKPKKSLLEVDDNGAKAR